MADFEAIYKEHFLNVYRYVLSLCHNESLAEEITQEAFYKALNGIERFDRRCQLYVWLCQIAKNTYFTYAKKQQRHTSEAVADMPLDVTSEIESSFLDKETARKLHVLLHQLKDPYICRYS